MKLIFVGKVEGCIIFQVLIFEFYEEVNIIRIYYYPSQMYRSYFRTIIEVVI